MAAAPSRRPAAPGFSPKTPPPGSSRPRAAGDAQCDALRVPDVICPSQPVPPPPRPGPEVALPDAGLQVLPHPADERPGSRSRLPGGAAPSARARFVRPGRAGGARRPAPSPAGGPRSPAPQPLPPPPAPPHRPRRPPRASARRDDVSATHWPSRQDPTDWLSRQRLPSRPASDPAGCPHWPTAGVALAAGDSRGPGLPGQRHGAAAGRAGAAAGLGARVPAAERAAAGPGAGCPGTGG